MTVDEYKTILFGMSDELFTTFRQEYGGEGDRKRYVREFIDKPQHEALLCHILRIPTEQERVNQAQIKAAEATIEAANAGRSKLKVDPESISMPPNVLISWSKARSRKVATSIYEWLPQTLPGVVPWMSTKDISKGKEWFRELQTKLADFQQCIICITQENLHSPWLYYEAGAIAAKIGPDSRVCSYLIGVHPDELAGTPLSQFQSTVAERDDSFELIASLNQAAGLNHETTLLRSHFNKSWRTLDKALKDASEMQIELTASDATSQVRSEAENLVNRPLSVEERRLLFAAAELRRSLISYSSGVSFRSLTVGKVDFLKGASAPSVTVWKEAIESLERSKCLKQIGKGNYELTVKGYKVAGALLFADFEDWEDLAELGFQTRALLVDASHDPSAEIVLMNTLDQSSIRTNGTEHANNDEQQFEELQEGLGQLMNLGLVREQSTSGFFRVTKKGFTVAEVIQKKTPPEESSFGTIAGLEAMMGDLLDAMRHDIAGQPLGRMVIHSDPLPGTWSGPRIFFVYRDNIIPNLIDKFHILEARGLITHDEGPCYYLSEDFAQYLLNQ